MNIRGKSSNEKRLIDADALLEKMKRTSRYFDVLFDVEEMPTVDAVEIVRCRECKHRYTENCPMYFHDSYWHDGYFDYIDYDTDNTEDDYFCPKGEREEVLDNGLL